MLRLLRRAAAAAVFALLATMLPASAAECGHGGEGAVSIHYDTGKTALTAEHKRLLTEFASVAKFRDWVCIFAQVDAQGSAAVNKRIANARAENVKKFLIAKGVKARNILIAAEEKGHTLFGLLGADQQNDRRVTVSYE